MKEARALVTVPPGAPIDAHGTAFRSPLLAPG